MTGQLGQLVEHRAGGVEVAAVERLLEAHGPTNTAPAAGGGSRPAARCGFRRPLRRAAVSTCAAVPVTVEPLEPLGAHAAQPLELSRHGVQLFLCCSPSPVILQV